MKLYTRSGDNGETILWGGIKTSKSSLRIDTIGVVDELNAYLGLCVSSLDPMHGDILQILIQCQHDLFALGAELAGAKDSRRLVEEDVSSLEGHIDRLTAEVPALTNFILPGGHESAAQLQVARTVARRAERGAVALAKFEEGTVRPDVIRFLNRLSDLLFAAARCVNARNSVEEPMWKG